jgi:RNA polymerase sigma factor (sigma-70 family)
MALQANGLIRQLREIVLPPDDVGTPDGQLLKCFLARRDEAAFAALLRRHGPMVLAVCRRILHNSHDAEDAFQATFLVLVRKARSIGRPELLGNWLYGVAYRTALAARGAAVKRRARERDMAKPEAVEDAGTPELPALLDRELVRLPEKYRVPLVLCDLEGKTRKEAARHLGWPEGTLHGRLARGRLMLARRLRRQGIAFSAGTMAALLSQNAASATVPTSVAVSTIKAASLLVAGQTAAAGFISPKVAALTDGVVKVMLLSKLKATLAVVLVLGFLATGAAVLTGRIASAQGSQTHLTVLEGQDVQPRQTDKKSQTGDDSKKRVAFELRDETWSRILEKVTDITGLPLISSIPPPRARFSHVGPKGRLYSIAEVFEIVNSGLALHKLKLIRLEKANVLTLVPLVMKQKQEKTPFTAWGKEVGGLQAGLGYDPGKKRAYRHGETVRLVLRIRNVGKKAVDFEYVPQYFLEESPTMTDGQGKPVDLPRTAGTPRPRPKKVSLAAGKEIELFELKLKLRPPTEGAENDTDSLDFAGKVLIFYGTGKFQIQYERLVEKPWAPMPDPILSKLASGKLDLEVKPIPPRAAPKEKAQAAAEPPREETIATFKNVTIDNVDDRTRTVSFSFGNKKTPTKLLNIPLAEKVRVVASYRFPGSVNHLPFRWEYVKALKGKVVSARFIANELGFLVESICAGNDAPADAGKIKPVKILVWIEKRSADPGSLTASCMTVGQVSSDMVFQRLENLPISKTARITHNGKDIALTALKPGTGAALELDSSEGTFVGIAIKVIRQGQAPADTGGGVKTPHAAKARTGNDERSADELPWGNAVKGVQARLRPKKARWQTKEAPAFELELRNQGKRPWKGVATQHFCELQIDGKWYKYGANFPGSPLTALKPGMHADHWLDVSLGSQWYKVADEKVKPAEEDKPGGKGGPIILAPGKHTIRLAYRLTNARGGDEVPEIRVQTNAVEIEIPAEAKDSVNDSPSGKGRKARDPDAEVEQPAWGKPLNGLKLGLYQTDPKGDGRPRLTIVLENMGSEDLVVILGQSTARGKKHRLSQIGLKLTFADEMLKRPRALISKGSKRDDLVDGPISSFLVVQLVAGGRYVISSDLHDYYDPKDVNAVLAPGKYRVAAKFVGQAYLRSKTDTGPHTYLDHMTYWTGTIESEHIQVTLPEKPAK